MKTSQQLIAEAKAAIEEISVAQLQQVLQRDSEAVLIDVRESSEFQQQHILGAVNYPRGVLEMNIHHHPKVAATGCEPAIALAQLAKQQIYLICRSGGRSALAAESLQRMGFAKVYSVAGGMQAWLDAALPVKQ